MLRGGAFRGALTVLVTALFSSFAADAGAERRGDCVVLICIDGLGTSQLQHCSKLRPNLQKLAEQGAVATEGLRLVFPTVCWPMHTTLVTATSLKGHGVVANLVDDGETMHSVILQGDTFYGQAGTRSARDRR
jgi:predicted AlkP superfamily pyrophosphatase or phosphodiesterase